MSVDADQDDRDLEGELASAEAGQSGIPVDAVCVGCGRTRVKRASLEELDQPDADPTTLEASDCTSFKHVCYPCQGATWWNPVAVLTGLLESERGE
ncbi:hypothetical protein NP511_13440 [Natrinema thermotolerans]|uniref:Uncharacterized protein n=1 Tax=Natrinema thermotolerans TaxID=121872 RepID=A0AAF0PCV8_9EURY|nr:hypothetical protein [Natrinema thermotolerans]QCC59417.1 hypothetical protein DVR14_12570 [Natrinema thermotolerans]WMT06388.1 hypothetical protein NP511_13440 [Natrinema thermotolerans]